MTTRTVLRMAFPPCFWKVRVSCPKVPTYSDITGFPQLREAGNSTCAVASRMRVVKERSISELCMNTIFPAYFFPPVRALHSHPKHLTLNFLQGHGFTSCLYVA